jgi:ribonucleoside-diphosphate reductase alpha chain
MSVKALQDYTFTSKYARYLPESKRRETWNEAIDRVRDMHIRRYPEIKEEITWAFEQSRQKRVLGSQRALQFGGSAIEKKHSRIFNCIASYCDRQRFFQEALWLLLSGCGVGFSVQKHHIAKLPAFSKKWVGRLDMPDSRTHVIVDSIEGWADSVGVLLSSFFGGGDFPEYEGFEVLFDYSQIRPEGAALGSSSGKAPGPKPLQRALDKAKDLIMSRIASGHERLKTIDAYDIVMHLSDAVLSGGVRRSATICLFSPDDEEMATAKIGNWFIDNPQRGRSNNSALLLRDKTTKEEFEKLMGYVREFGEPGFVWSDSTELVVNPCVEIGLYPVDVETGESGWEACNLCEINGKKCKTPEDFEIACRAAAIIGTCQAGYSDLQYLGPVSKRIIEKEALLGVSITGMMDNPDILLSLKLTRILQRKLA